MGDKISGINSVSPYNGRNNQNNNSNFNKKQKNESNDFEELYNSMIYTNNMKPVSKGVQIESNRSIIFDEGDLFLYPIKYAYCPVYLTKTIDERDIIGYIASKCFVVEHKINYLPDRISEEYEIVFPYNSIVESFPKINLPLFENNKCINSFKYSEVFENYKEAKDKADEINKKLNLDIDKLKSLDTFEEIVFRRTESLDITKSNVVRRKY